MSDAGAAVLVVDGVGRRYDDGQVQALHQVSFQARAGETVALTGPSGCGKSTLLSLIGLLDQPDEGRIWVAGQELARVRRPAAFRACHIGFVFQFHHMVPTMTLRENVEAPMLAAGLSRTQRRERVEELLQAVDLIARGDALPCRVSGGERQRAAVARALANRPALVLADEPTGNLDSGNGQRVVDLLLAQARNQGALVIVATHNPEVATRHQRQLALRDGRLQTVEGVDGSP